MGFLSWVIPLISSFFDSGIFEYVFVYIIALAFLATVPVIIMYIFKK